MISPAFLYRFLCCGVYFKDVWIWGRIIFFLKYSNSQFFNVIWEKRWTISWPQGRGGKLSRSPHSSNWLLPWRWEIETILNYITRTQPKELHVQFTFLLSRSWLSIAIHFGSPCCGLLQLRSFLTTLKRTQIPAAPRWGGSPVRFPFPNPGAFLSNVALNDLWDLW